MSVYIIQNQHLVDKKTGTMRQKYNFQPAEKFGEIVFLLSPLAVPSRPQEIVVELQEKLSNFSDGDYLLLIGNPCFIGWSTAAAAAANNGRVKMLQWNGSRKRYYEIRAKDLI